MDTGCTQMHPATLAAIVIELIMLGAQLILVMNRPDERTRLWYLVLLIMLMACNLTRGLVPDPGSPIPVYIQQIINYGFGFLTASYFPFYFYKAFGLVPLRLHALYGAPLFFLLPYMVCFWVIYPVDNDLNAAIKHVVIVPFGYALVLLWAILRAIRKTYRERNESGNPLLSEEMLVYAAIVPWAAVALVLYFRLGQFAETLFTNIGFLFTTAILLFRSVKLSRAEREQFKQIRMIGNNPAPYFDVHCIKYNLTRREIEVAGLVRRGWTNPAIADSLNISLTTVKSHIEHLLHKTGTDNRFKLVQKLIYGDNI